MLEMILRFGPFATSASLMKRRLLAYLLKSMGHLYSARLLALPSPAPAAREVFPSMTVARAVMALTPQSGRAPLPVDRARGLGCHDTAPCESFLRPHRA